MWRSLNVMVLRDRPLEGNYEIMRVAAQRYCSYLYKTWKRALPPTCEDKTN